MELEIVRAKYKTGRYIGKLIEMKEEENRALFQVLAVETHPQQGTCISQSKLMFRSFINEKR